ncbi:T9SS type A sorting domain-containing protein [Winogradskyella sp. PG-2]|uniref:T9SS type A sorting domain-containing protein n=1 Tax=Winogradskyella sp. PG-2 TaxID=754409 RepID=UPI0004588FB7|nr:T9SS type A sorting domain-containing protein [Winogradskyella sp. PG-2]BAO77297.1 lysyl endopeptidase [Winogradskyella sp. PG-2]
MKNTLLFAFIFMFSLCFAQEIPEDVKPPSWNLDNLSNVIPFKLAPFNLKNLQDEDEINDKDQSKPWRFGHDIYVDHSFNDVGEWTTLENGDRIWRMSYKSKNAHTINFMFDVFRIPVGAKLYVYNNEKTDILRPFTHHNNNPEEILGTWLVEGDQAWIEYYQPAHVTDKAKIVVGSVVHGYRTAETYQKGLNDSGACNQDVDCDITPSGADPFDLDTVKENVKKANAMMVTGSNGFCSGTLINNSNNDGTPYFMTANHCGGGEAGWAFRFNWRSPNPSCSTNVNSTNGTFNQTVSGAILRANSSESDMELVEITDTSFFSNNSDLVWAGWNRSTTDLPALNFGIHHPNGDIQKTCRDDEGATRVVSPFNGNSTAKMWLIDDWDLGVTSQGSSGSALYNETGHLIGVLSGGGAQCSGTVDNGLSDIYGRFGVAWDFGSTQASRLKEWLDPSNSGVNVLDQYPPLETFGLDARVSAGSGNDSEICNEAFSPEVTLINPGNLTLSSADVTYYIDSESSTTVNWSGLLTSGGSVVVATPTFSNLSSGDHTFTISVNNPNAGSDENTSNDNFVFNFNVSPSYSTSEIVFNILTDNYGSETTWELRNSLGAIVSSGPSTPYANATTYQETITIPSFNECYTFTISDSADDGICCGYGIGNYNIEDANGNVIINSSGNFGTSESILFKAQDPLSLNEFGLDDLVNIFPNPVKDNLGIVLTSISENVKYQIFNTLGQNIANGNLEGNMMHNINMSQYLSGIYFIKLSTSSSTITKKVIKK